MFNAKIITDSVSPNGVRLTTMEVTMPRPILPEFNTHRVFSRNSASSRAIPVEKRISMVVKDPFIPETFGKNAKGMQSWEILEGDLSAQAEKIWREACDDAIHHAKALAQLGVHKQYANRLLEPFCWQTVLVTSTEWENYFHLRLDKAAQPEIQRVSRLMFEAMQKNEPNYVGYGEWHLPLVYEQDIEELSGFMPRLDNNSYDIGEVNEFIETLKLISAGRCARVSYLTHDGRKDFNADITLANNLISSGHLSPLEHQARPLSPDTDDEDVYRKRGFVGNFRMWTQFRKEIPFEFDVLGHKN